VEEPTPSQTEDETTGGLRASTVGALATSGSSVPTDWKKKWQYAYGLLETSSPKEGAM
jgi:hypothetical protein